jgi:CHASE1-domain containing sensor protein/predicted Ser/Thr protein kinase
MSSPASTTLKRHRAALAATCVGLALTALATFLAYRQAAADAEAEFRDRAQAIAATVQDNFKLPLESLRAISALARMDRKLPSDKFGRFARALMEAHESLAALEWADLVQRPDRSKFESDMSAVLNRPFEIREPGEHGVMVRSRDRNYHLTLTFLEPHIRDLEGLDLCFEPNRASAIEQMIAGRKMYVTTKFRLIEDPPNVYSVAVYDPVIEGDKVVGASMALYRLEPLLRAALSSVDLANVDVSLTEADDSLPAEDRSLFESRPGAAHPSSDRWALTHSTQFVSRTWEIMISEPRVVQSTRAAIIGAIGIIASLVAGYLIAARETRQRLERALMRERQLGDYTLIRKLGEGGMGAVFEARHRLLRRKVAVKLVQAERATSELVERFAHEAQTTSELTHPNTVTLFDYGVAEDGRLYLVMEYLDGMNLDELVRIAGPQPEARVRHLLLQICGSLSEAHSVGVIHRDIKSANVMVCRVGGVCDFVKILDFGLAKHRDTEALKLSVPGTILGTLTNIAPEVLMDGKAASPRSDLYAVGCIAYQLLAGRDPFEASDQTAMVSAHLFKKPTPLEERLNPGLSAVVMKCLEKDPARRYTSAAELASELDALELDPWGDAEAAAWWDAHQPVVEPTASDESFVRIRPRRVA